MLIIQSNVDPGLMAEKLSALGRLAQDLLPEGFRDENAEADASLLKQGALVFFAAVGRTCSSIHLLCLRGRSDTALPLCRFVFESYLTLKYIANGTTESDRAKRMRRYLFYGSVITWRLIEKARANPTDTYLNELLRNQEWVDSQEAQYREAVTKFPELDVATSKRGKQESTQHWLGLGWSVARLARELQEEEAYRYLYALMSDATHGGAQSIRRYFQHNPGPPQTIRIAPPDDPKATAACLKIAYDGLLYVCSFMSPILELDEVAFEPVMAMAESVPPVQPA